MGWIPSLLHMLVHSADVNWMPPLVVTAHGKPEHAIQVEM
jgi:hypothetical protein